MVDGLYLLPHLASGTVLCPAQEVGVKTARAIKVALPQAVPAGEEIPEINVLVLRLASGGLRGYLNRCTHFGLPLDALEGYPFLDDEGDELVLRCQHHYMEFSPETGEGLSFECRGDSLTEIPLTEVDGQIVTV